MRIYTEEQRIKNKIRATKWQKENRVRHNEIYKKWYKNNPNKIREIHLKKTYNITLEEYNKLFQQQNGLCLGCYKHQTQLNRKLFVDHNHKTGKVRGLLCYYCNSILGYSKDSIENLLRLVDYLKKQRGA